DGASMGARVHWRPTRNGWADFYKEVSFLMFEGVRQTAYKVFKLKSEEKPLGYKESFLGEINIAFDRVPLPFRNWRGYDRFDFVFEPQDRIGPIGRYNGRLTVSHQAEIENERELKISFHTNWNMLNIDREFEFIGEIDESAK